MNTRLLLNALRSTGVVLTPEEDGLHVDVPAGVLTETLRSSLVEHKEALIELLERERIQARSGRQARSHHPLVRVPGLDRAARPSYRRVA